MARIRTIKPEIWQDEKLAELSRDVRLLFIGLISMADDEGRLRAPAKLIRSQVFPYDDLSVARVDGWLLELHEARLIDLYEGGGQRYARIPKWKDHQTVNKPQLSKIPPACKAYPILKRASMQGIHDPLPEDYGSATGGNGMEGKGGEGKGLALTELVGGAPTEPDRNQQIRDVFDYWLRTERETGGMGSDGTSKPRLIETRRTKINARLAEGYTVADLKQAIAFYCRDPWHLGDNDRSTRYTDLTTTLKNGAKVEAGIAGYADRHSVAGAATNSALDDLRRKFG